MHCTLEVYSRDNDHKHQTLEAIRTQKKRLSGIIKTPQDAFNKSLVDFFEELLKGEFFKIILNTILRYFTRKWFKL